MAWEPEPTRSSGSSLGLGKMTDHDDPIALFGVELARARAADPALATDVPMALATTSTDGVPSVRYVLLKSADARGFVFYTNRESHKGRDLELTKRAALAFHFAATAVQVRVEGAVEPVTDAESDAYFATRDRASQIGAWASQQSRLLASREVLDQAVADFETRFVGKPVSRPPYWGGYRVIPERIEIWHGRADRLHDRLVYLREGDAWRAVRLWP